MVSTTGLFARFEHGFYTAGRQGTGSFAGLAVDERAFCFHLCDDKRRARMHCELPERQGNSFITKQIDGWSE